MPSGACVIKRTGPRGSVWYLKYRDASGKQIKERLGRVDEDWTKRKAEVELRARLTDVEKEGFKRPERMTFASFAGEWLDGYADARSLKHSTKRGYRVIVDKHLAPTFGTYDLTEIGVEHVERLVVTKRRAGLSPATCNRILNVLSLVLNAALKRGLIRTNPVSLADRPKEGRRRWRIFAPAEVVEVEHSFDALIEEAENDRDRDDLVVARRLYLAHMGTGVRRGEAAGLRWRAVLLADPDGPIIRVEETFTRSRVDTPKSEAGHRTISLGAKVAAELFEHRRWSAFDGDGEYVFPNPRTGRPFGANRYGELFRNALTRACIEGYVRPSHDLRHSSITNAAAAGAPPSALMSRAGHSSFTTTQRYIDLAGERFRAEADRLEDRLWGASGTKSRYHDAESASDEGAQEAENPQRVSGEGGI